MATKGNDAVDKSCSEDGTFFVKWKGSEIKKLEFADYEKWLDIVDENEGQDNRLLIV